LTKYIIKGDGPSKDCDIMYSLPLSYFKFKKFMIIKNNNKNCLKSLNFIINIDGN